MQQEGVFRTVFVIGILLSLVAMGWLYFPQDYTAIGEGSEPNGEGQNTPNVTEVKSEGNHTNTSVESRKSKYLGDTEVVEGGYGAFGSNVTDPLFDEVSSEVGLTGIPAPERDLHYAESDAISGIYTSDFNEDGYVDVLATGPSGVYMFENDGGDYEMYSDTPDVNTSVASAHFFDHDNDGYDDLYLLSDNGSVFLENVDGRFERRDSELNVAYESVRGAATADYTGNGCLDVFVIQSGDWGDNVPESYNDRNVAISEDNGNRNRLFAGDCEEFEETTEEAGIRSETWSLATSFVDFTNDSHPDIHVANDFNKDIVYVNNGDGTFERNVLPNFTNRNGMSSEVTDINNDGLLDIFVTNIYYEGLPDDMYGRRIEGNNLLLNKGEGEFVDAASEYGVRKGGWGWAAVFEDFNNDGILDLYHTEAGSGFGKSYPNFWKGVETDGTQRFERLNASQAGFSQDHEAGLAAIDYNNDGGLDIVSVNISQNILLYENLNEEGSALEVELGRQNKTDVGSSVRVGFGNRTETRVLTSESDYRSQSSRTLHFGTGNSSVVDVTVEWNGGGATEVSEVETGQRITVAREGVVDKTSLGN